MAVQLNPTIENMIRQDVERGPYTSAEEFVERAVQMLHEQEEWLLANRAKISADVEHGFQQAERGELVDRDEAIRILRTRHRAALDRS
jgi:putative addiction module CopG family antidote